MPAISLEKPLAPPSAAVSRRSVQRLLAPLNAVVENSRRLLSKSLRQFESAGLAYNLPRYVYLGTKGGGDAIRIGIFATIHGDEPEGALALARFVSLLEDNPEVAKGYELFLLPQASRHARSTG